MEKVKIFKINHTKLKKGIYVSKRIQVGNECITVFDLRFRTPNIEVPMSSSAAHTIEHIGGMLLRSAIFTDNAVISFTPVGSLTGFRLELRGDYNSMKIANDIMNMCNMILSWTGEIPGSTREDCGNYLDHDLNDAKFYTLEYLSALKTQPCYEYPL